MGASVLLLCCLRLNPTYASEAGSRLGVLEFQNGFRLVRIWLVVRIVVAVELAAYRAERNAPVSLQEAP